MVVMMFNSINGSRTLLKNVLEKLTSIFLCYDNFNEFLIWLKEKLWVCEKLSWGLGTN